MPPSVTPDGPNSPRELTIPVVGIGEAAILAASQHGRRFGMATTTPLLVTSLTELVMEHQRTEYFCGVRLTESDPLTLAAKCRSPVPGAAGGSTSVSCRRCPGCNYRWRATERNRPTAIQRT
ncbi:aspartate/glutamate racemase family protein [Arthrobacter sp. A5]|uniref:aspartate/glutamate racemase family protein n=1 Tax=Arthrobacter sp. A5 TaxID=576926 RepID=UPI003DA855D3